MRAASGSLAPIGEFRLEEERPRAGVVVLSLHGETDLHVANEVRRQLNAAISDEETSSMVVDLSDVTFIDSMGLGVLLGGMKRLHAKGGEFRLIVPERGIRRIFEMTLLDRVFALHPTREEALAASSPSAF